jgi:phenylacetate-CoA ligase
MLGALKIWTLKQSHRLPPGFNFALSKLNNNPSRIFGKQYQYHVQELKNRPATDREREEKLVKIANYVIRHIPYYNRIYGNTTVASVKEFQDTFGFITKPTVLEEPADFRPADFAISTYDLVTTAGTSGKPLQLYVPKKRYALEWATVHDAWGRVGYHFHHRAVLRNHRLPANRIYEVNPFTKEVIFDNFRMTDEYMREIYAVLKRYGIQFMHAYPSAVQQFAAFCAEEKLDLSFLKAFLSSSENVYPQQLAQVRRQTGARMFSFYGHTEKLLFGAFCEHTDHFHMDPDYGFFELIDEEGKPVKTPGQIGEMVGTTLNNLGMPLIRYKTGDHAEYLGDHCPHCHRKMPILKRIMGRWDGEKIYNPDGTYVTTTALNLHDDLYAKIGGLQYYQREKGILDVRIIKTPQFTQHDEEKMLRTIREKLHPSAVVNIKPVERLERKQNGKFLLLISEVPK